MASMDFLHELLRNSADGAYVVDQDQRIAAWNAAAEELLGFKARDVIGFPCHQILGGHSDGGCAVCRRGCLPFTAGRRGELVLSFDVQVRAADGHGRWVNVSIIPIALENGDDDAPIVVVHLFRDIEAKKRAETFAKEVVARARQLKLETKAAEAESDDNPMAVPLTKREIQVLALLAKGLDTDTVASQLVIGRSTARNHIERILHKLGVHSRLEAVAYAQKHNLLD